MLKLLIVTVAAVIVSRIPLDAQTRTFYPNSQRYKDSMPTTSNRSGAATLTGRALVDKNGRTLIELTTLPAFDTNQTPPGKISKVQIKGIKANGVVSYGNYKEQETGGTGHWPSRILRPRKSSKFRPTSGTSTLPAPTWSPLK